MNTTLEVIKQLRTETGAGVMACRKALQQSEQDYARALEALRAAAALKAEKQAGRQASQGRVELYTHGNGRIGVMVEINTETEFASRSQAFQQFAHEIALQITSAAPLYVCDEEITPHALEEQAQAARQKALAAGKPEAIIAQIVEGALEKYRAKHVLLRQPYLRDESLTVAQLLNQASAQIGEHIVIRRFARWEICPDAEGTPTA